MILNRTALPNALLHPVLVRRRRPRGTPYKRVGIYKADRLGDFVLALGSIRAIVEENGSENCILITSSHASEIAREEFPGLELVEIPPFDHRLTESWRQLRSLQREALYSRGVESLIVLRHHRTAHEEVLISGVPANSTIGALNSPLADFGREWFGPRLSFDQTVECCEPKEGECRDLALHRAVLAKVFGHTKFDARPRFNGRAVRVEDYVAVSPYGSSHIRDFPIHLLQAAGKLLQSLGAPEFLLLCPPGSEARYLELSTHLKAVGVRNCRVEVVPSSGRLVDRVAGARLVLTVETATCHIAAALDKPMVAILGGGHHGWFAPWNLSARQRWLTRSMPCAGCNWHCDRPEPECMTKIEMDEVARNIVQVLA